MAPDEVDAVQEGEPVEPIGHVRVVYLGPVAPHWEVQSDYGPADVIDNSATACSPGWCSCPPTTPSSGATANGSCVTPSASSSPSNGSSTGARRPRADLG